ncbi:hypothetical protein ACSBL2_17170 [Pedobacter sp. AW31-3R]|uniref:hypothetical protein n=1 Tax=Pedobacter sp. AW31-3R TaxID=3445781 RepID=UPI003FA15F9A
MAKFDGKFLRGVIGPTVLKKRGNTQQVLAKKAPGTVKQTMATKQASTTFGLASALSGWIRSALNLETQIAGDGSVPSRLSATLNLLLIQCRDQLVNEYRLMKDSFHGLTGFDFNGERRLADRLPGELTLQVNDGVLTLGFDEREIPRTLKFSRGVTSCELTFSMILMRLNKGLISQKTIRHSRMVLNENEDLNGLSFSFDVPNDCLYIIAASMEYFNRKKQVADPGLNVGGILAARMIQGVYMESKKILWQEMDLCF